MNGGTLSTSDPPSLRSSSVVVCRYAALRRGRVCSICHRICRCSSWRAPRRILRMQTAAVFCSHDSQVFFFCSNQCCESRSSITVRGVCGSASHANSWSCLPSRVSIVQNLVSVCSCRRRTHRIRPRFLSSCNFVIEIMSTSIV